MEAEEMVEEKVCCPVFKPEKWDHKDFHWKGKHFIKTSVPTFFHQPPLPLMRKRITKLMKAAEEANKIDERPDEVLMLFTDPNPFKSEIYLSVTGEVPGVENVDLDGDFYSEVFDGGYNAIPKFIKEMNTHLEERGQKSDKYYVHYAYCPECAKKYGHNYQILFANVN